jgi:hypothetical protein
MDAYFDSAIIVKLYVQETTSPDAIRLVGTKYLQCLTDLPQGADSVGRMAREFRVQYPGAIYHVMNRGDQREAVFRDDEDRQKLLATLGEACRKTEWPAVAPPPSCLGERFVTWKTWRGRQSRPWTPKTPGGGAGREFGAV